MRPGHRVLAAAVGAGLVGALVAPAPAPAADRVIRSRAGLVTAVGPLKPTDAGVSRLTMLFGQPSAVVGKGNTCTVRFSRARITVTLANFGGSEACDAGHAQYASVDGRAWHTQRGLYVGARSSRVKRLYPQARLRGRRWELQTAPLFGTPTVTLEAFVADARVSRIRAYLGGAGE